MNYCYVYPNPPENDIKLRFVTAAYIQMYFRRDVVTDENYVNLNQMFPKGAIWSESILLVIYVTYEHNK